MCSLYWLTAIFTIYQPQFFNTHLQITHIYFLTHFTIFKSVLQICPESQDSHRQFSFNISHFVRLKDLGFPGN